MDDHPGFVSIFDGQTLKDRVGDRALWRIENRVIVSESTREKPSGNSDISYHGIVAKDFDLKLEINVEKGGGSGIQYRSRTGLPWRRARPGDNSINLDWMMTGPQSDFGFRVCPNGFAYTGRFYSEDTPLGIIAWRGQVVNSIPGHRPRPVPNIADRSALAGYIRINE